MVQGLGKPGCSSGHRKATIYIQFAPPAACDRKAKMQIAAPPACADWSCFVARLLFRITLSSDLKSSKLVQRLVG